MRLSLVFLSHTFPLADRSHHRAVRFSEKTSRNSAMLVNNERLFKDYLPCGGMQLRILNNEKTYCMASMHNAHDVYAFFMFSIVPTYFCGLVQRK